MTTATTKRLNALRARLRFAGREPRPAIQAQIDALLAADAAPPEPEPEPEPQPEPEPPRAARDVPAGASWAFTEHRCFAEVPVPAAPASEMPQRRSNSPARHCEICGALFQPTTGNHRVCLKPECRRPRRAPYRSRQRLLPPARFRLSFDPAVVIQPARPAPVKRYTTGVPTPFQDDLNAIADHGSPGRLPAPPDIGWAPLSVLA